MSQLPSTCTDFTYQEAEPGVWNRSLPYRVLVQKSSAIQRGTLQDDTIPVDEDHSNMVKFAENDEVYKRLCARIEKVQNLRPAADDVQRHIPAHPNAIVHRQRQTALECKWQLSNSSNLPVINSQQLYAKV